MSKVNKDWLRSALAGITVDSIQLSGKIGAIFTELNETIFNNMFRVYVTSSKLLIDLNSIEIFFTNQNIFHCKFIDY